MYSQEEKKLRYKTALKLRAEKHTLEHIGEKLGVSKTQAAKIIKDAIQEKNIDKASINAIPCRPRNALLAKGYETLDQIIQAIESGEIHVGFIPNYGKKAHQYVLDWIQKNKKVK